MSKPPFSYKMGLLQLAVLFLFVGCQPMPTGKAKQHIKRLHHPDPSIRLHAARALGLFPKQAKKIAPWLVERLNDRSPHVRLAAAYSLCQLSQLPASTVWRITNTAKHLNSWGQFKLINAFSHRLTKVSPALLSGLQAKRKIQEQSAWMIGQLASSKHPHLISPTKPNEQTGKRTHKNQTTNDKEQKLTELHRAAIPILAELLHHKTLTLQRAAAEALQAISMKKALPSGVWKQLALAVRRSGSQSVRRASMKAITQQFRLGALHLPALFLLHRSPRLEIRIKALTCLGRTKPQTSAVMERLTQSLHATNWKERVAAMRALRQFGKKATPLLLQTWQHSKPNTPDRRILLRIIARMRPIEHLITKQLFQALTDKDPWVQRVAFEELPAHIPRLSQVPPVIYQQMQHKQWNIRVRSLRLLLFFNKNARRVLSNVRPLLGDPHIEVTTVAIQVLCSQRPEDRKSLVLYHKLCIPQITSKPSSKPASQPISKPASQPISKPVSQPIPKPVPQPVH